MKTICTLLLSILMAVSVIAQTSKMVLYEGFTSASCVPCANQDPAINALAEANLDKLVPIKYHVSWFGPDPMNAHNPTEVTSRTGYYSVNSTPSSRVNGQDLGFTQGVINNQYSEDGAAIAIDIDAKLDEDWEEISVKVDVTAVQNVTAAGLRVRIAVVERNIIFDSPPGVAGSTDFYYVMKKFLPDANGLSIPPPLAPNETLTFNQSWQVQNVYEVPELAVVVFIQNDNDKTVWQAAVSNVDIPVPHDSDVALLDMKVFDHENANNDYCEFTVSPSVRIRNDGNHTLTSAHIKYRVNDGTYKYFDWTGSLETFESEWVDLPQAAFYHHESGENTVIAEIHSPNGATDQNPTNTTISEQFNSAPNSSGNIQYTLSHDQFDFEITWEVLNSSGNLIYSGGPYHDSMPGVKQYTFNLTENDCYTFVVYDDWGDGQIGDAEGVTLKDLHTDEYIIEKMADYGFEGRVVFGVNAKQSALYPDSSEVYSSIKDFDLISELSIYPNPATDLVYVEFESTENVRLNIELYDLTGRKIDTAVPVNGKLVFHTAHLSNGVYFIRLISDNQLAAVSKLIISR